MAASRDAFPILELLIDRSPTSRSDRAWVAILAASYAFGLAVSWQRWGNPLIDTGREMNLPLRLAGGEMLYSDVRHIYGPLSPWLHAGLFRMFGPSLDVLYADGIVTAATILALMYWLGRQIMSPASAGAATLITTWLCAFKPAGNYILPYSYNALHAVALGLITLAILISALKRPRNATGARFVLAGLIAGLAMLAKTETGLAALAAGIAAAFLAPYPDGRRGVLLAAVFFLAAMCLTLAVYVPIAAAVGWSTLVLDSWLLFYNVPPELAYFNGWISGFDDPLKSLRRMLIAAVKLGVVAVIVGTSSSIIAGSAPVRRASSVLGTVAAVVVVMWATTGLDLDKGFFLAMPFLLVGVLLTSVRRIWSRRPARLRVRTALLIVFALYGLASLARMILHVRSGGAYGSYLLPVSVLVFTYLCTYPFPRLFGDASTRRVARVVTLALIVGSSAATAGILAYRYRTRITAAISTPRGTMFAEPDVGQAWNEALAFIDAHTRPDDAIAILPEGTSLNFLSDRKNPLRNEITIPGVLDAAAESSAIQQLQDAGTRFIFITNRPTSEFGRTAFGRDYCQRLMRWIEANYITCATFGPVKKANLKIGDPPFFIHAYCPRRHTQAMR